MRICANQDAWRVRGRAGATLRFIGSRLQQRGGAGVGLEGELRDRRRRQRRGRGEPRDAAVRVHDEVALRDRVRGGGLRRRREHGQQRDVARGALRLQCLASVARVVTFSDGTTLAVPGRALAQEAPRGLGARAFFAS